MSMKLLYPVALNTTIQTLAANCLIVRSGYFMPHGVRTESVTGVIG